MRKLSDNEGVARILDANMNRASEGLRVCEETARFVLCDRSLTAGLKSVRHRLEEIMAGSVRSALMGHRDSGGDVGRRLTSDSELRRAGCEDIFFANIQRVKESLRVLEEYSKLRDRSAAIQFKELRYAVYGLEKKAAAVMPKKPGNCR